MEIIAVAIGVPLMNFLTQYAKTKYNLKGEVVLVGVALVVGLVYSLFQVFVPDMLEAKVIDFVSQVFTLSVLVYEFIIKKVLPNEKK